PGHKRGVDPVDLFPHPLEDDGTRTEKLIEEDGDQVRGPTVSDTLGNDLCIAIRPRAFGHGRVGGNVLECLLGLMIQLPIFPTLWVIFWMIRLMGWLVIGN